MRKNCSQFVRVELQRLFALKNIEISTILSLTLMNIQIQSKIYFQNLLKVFLYFLIGKGLIAWLIIKVDYNAIRIEKSSVSECKKKL